jgi:branched-chain amino acid transport system ATP-binding protein
MLETRNLSVFYGRHRALEGVSIAVDRGEICVILGANGAGKSTLLKAIAGLVPSAPGSTLSVNGTAISGMKPNQIVEMGITLVPEGRAIFGELSVAENLELGAYAARARREEKATLERVYRLFPQLAERRAQTVRTMSGGEQQMVAIGRALMSKPDILMLDEPSLGLSPILSAELFKVLADIGRTGVGILLVEQNAKQSLKIADRGYLLENGHIVGEDSARVLASDPSVIRAYLGGEAEAAAAGRIELALPAAMPLSAMGAGELSQLAGGLARRAQAIQSSYLRAVRRAAAMPSAFVGRYDKDADRETLAGMMGFDHPGVSPDARKLSAAAGDLARRAAETHAFHIQTRRLSGPSPSAFSQSAAPAKPQASADAAADAAPVATAAPGASDLARMAEDLARNAAEIQSEYIQAKRNSTDKPSAFARREDGGRGEPAAGNGRDTGGEDAPHSESGLPRDMVQAPTRNGADPSLKACELAERAARLQSAHLAAARASAAIPSAFAAAAQASSTHSPIGGKPPGKSTNGKLTSKGA